MLGSLLPSALTTYNRFGSTCVVPEEGTGPLGRPGGGRWITSFDLHCANASLSPPPRRTVIGVDVPRPPTLPPLRPYQIEAVERVRCESGVVELGCGLGKTWIGGELARRVHTAVVVTQHVMSVDQWKQHFQQVLKMDAKVFTYAHVARAHTALARREPPSSLDVCELFCFEFDLLVLDEVHVAVAKHFVAACSLRAKRVVGLSGSLVREDSRLAHLETLVGPVRFSMIDGRRSTYTVIKVPLHPSVADATSRSRLHLARRALSPYKLAALRDVIRRADTRVVVFCDSRLAVDVLSSGDLSHALVMHGDVEEEKRRRVLEAFRAAPRDGLLLATRVCESAVDFPEGCLVVNLHVASGSRQQEIQRSGRGSRSESTASRVVHIVTAGTEEEGFVRRRVAHVGVDVELVEFEGSVSGRGPIAIADNTRRHKKKMDNREKLRQKLREKRNARTGGGGGSGEKPSIEPALMQACGDDPQLLALACELAKHKSPSQLLSELVKPLDEKVEDEEDEEDVPRPS